jgi:hypothetical protein
MGSRTRESLLLWKIIVVGKEDKGERRIQVFPFWDSSICIGYFQTSVWR